MRRPLALAVAAVASAATLSACGTQDNQVKGQSAAVEKGAALFSSHCSGCHTLDKVGAQGSATEINDRERVDGPNFNQRRECVPNVLYAIRNGGYSGAIMPENIVVGENANDIAKFLAKYAGSQSKSTPGSAKFKCANHP